MIKNTQKRIVFFFAGIALMGAILLCIYSFSKQHGSVITPAKGTLDLHNWQPERDGILSLNGDWEFYWKSFRTSQDFFSTNPVPDIMAKIPDVWNHYKLNGKNLPGFGYGTYRLKVVNAPKGETLSLRIPTFSTAYELYVNDRMLSSNGKVAESRNGFAPEYKPQIIQFTPEDTRFELIVHVANFTYARGGMWFAMDLGTPGQIKNLDHLILFKDLLLFGALSVMALYYLSFFLLRREDRSSLYFVLMCIMFAGRILIYGNCLIGSFLPFIGFHGIVFIEYASLCCFPVFAVLMVSRLFPDESPRKIQIGVSVYGAAMALLFAVTPISFYTRLIYFIQAAAVLIGFYAIICVCRAYFHGRKDAPLLMLGGMPVVIAAVHDILYQNNVILSTYGEYVTFGFFLLLFMQSFVLSRRSAEVFREVSALSRKLMKLDKMKDEFLANTTHELRTPLNGMIGISEALIKGSEGELSHAQKQSLSIVAGSGRRLANLVNDLLDYSKLRYGDILLHTRPIRIDGLIHTVVSVFRQINKSKDCEVYSEIPGDLPMVMADENRVAQILYNLIGNAVKFTTKGYVNLSAKTSGNKLELCVRDTGEGIPEDKLEDIFKSFEQVDTSMTRRHGGTGLGLFITRQLVEMQGGRLWVESKLGEGSSFYFTLPVTDQVPDGEEVDMALPEFGDMDLSEPIPRADRENGNIRVLLVDDDAVSLKAAKAILKLGGYAVTTANSGEGALQEIDRHSDYALVILDVMMPQMSGYEVCSRIRENKFEFELPILMLTAKTSTEDIITGLKAGANDYLPKPFEPEELLARVNTLVKLKDSVDRAMTAEVSFLQAQIKPHFLYNTLNTISSFCDTDPQRARQLIDSFSSYLRQSLYFNDFNMSVPIENEIHLLNSYLEIEKARFGDKLKVQYDIDESVKAEIPMLSIQPLVENAISHGIRKKRGADTVTITVKSTPDGLVVSVSDNGAGIPPEKLAEIFVRDSSNGIGLKNIDKRLKKLFGKGLTIESEPGTGTVVWFTVPPEVI